jgi:hypothetical protein
MRNAAAETAVRQAVLTMLERSTRNLLAEFPGERMLASVIFALLEFNISAHAPFISAQTGLGLVNREQVKRGEAGKRRVILIWS